MAINDHDVTVEESRYDYKDCIITPMTEQDGRPVFKIVHVVDALIVGGIIFFSLLLGASIPAVLSGDIAYLTYSEVTNRFLTALVGFGLTFFAQWARYRGIQVISILEGRKKRRNSDESDDGGGS